MQASDTNILNHVGCGIMNKGNTCFLNSVLQCLLHIQGFIVRLRLHKHGRTNTNNNSNLNNNNSTKSKVTQTWCILCELQTIYQTSKTARIVQPDNMLAHLPLFFSKFKLGKQQDAHQLLRYLMDELHRLDGNGIDNIFSGRMRNTVWCENCKNPSTTVENFYDYSLDCISAPNLQQAIQNYFRIDELSGENKYRCDKCVRETNARKQFVCQTVPPVLTIHLKRFSNSLRKVSRFLQFPKVLTIQAAQSAKKEYDLQSVIVHTGGGAQSGHYYSMVKWEGLWYKMDDRRVTRIEEPTVFLQNAYILFYVSPEPVSSYTSSPPKPVNNSIRIVKDDKRNNTHTKSQAALKIEVPKKIETLANIKPTLVKQTESSQNIKSPSQTNPRRIRDRISKKELNSLNIQYFPRARPQVKNGDIKIQQQIQTQQQFRRGRSQGSLIIAGEPRKKLKPV